MEQDLLECQALVEDADRLAACVSSLPGVSDMVSEYRALYVDVRTRLDAAKSEVVGDVDTAVQVSKLFNVYLTNNIRLVSVVYSAT